MTDIIQIHSRIDRYGRTIKEVIMLQPNSGKSTTYRIVQAIKATGNKPGVVAQWKSMVEQWANNEVNNPDAVAVRAWLPFWQVRKAYTAAELAPIWPVLGVVLGITKTLEHQKSAKRLENELDFTGLPYLIENGIRYYLVERIHLGHIHGN